MTLKDSLEQLKAYRERPINVITAYYVLCTEEDHPLHGYPINISEFLFLLQRVHEIPSQGHLLSRLSLCGTDRDGKEQYIPFIHCDQWVQGSSSYGTSMIYGTRTKENQAIFNGEKHFIDYLFWLQNPT